MKSEIFVFGGTVFSVRRKSKLYTEKIYGIPKFICLKKLSLLIGKGGHTLNSLDHILRFWFAYPNFSEKRCKNFTRVFHQRALSDAGGFFPTFFLSFFSWNRPLLAVDQKEVQNPIYVIRPLCMERKRIFFYTKKFPGTIEYFNLTWVPRIHVIGQKRGVLL